MATPISFSEQNSVVGGDGPNANVPLFRDGARNVTCHALTPEEMLEILNTGKVWLITPGNNYTESKVTGLYPFDKRVQ